MTGCGCLLLVGLLAVLFWLFTFGATDPGEQLQPAVALALAGYALMAIAGRRAAHSVTRS